MSPVFNNKKVLLPREKTLIEMMFVKHGYTQEDVEDFFDPPRMDNRFKRALDEMRSERAKPKVEPVLQQCQDEPCTD